MNNVSVLIVDDEKNSIDFLKLILLKKVLRIKHVYTASSVSQAELIVKNKNIDLLFLDIEMPDGNGFDLLEKIPDYRGKIIFTTAYSQYAIKAFKYGAVNYFLKPYDENEIAASVNRLIQEGVDVNQELPVRQIEIDYGPYTNPPYKIAITTSNGLTFINHSLIIRCESDGKYTTCYLKNHSRPIVVSKNLKEFEMILDSKIFFRIHHSHLINIHLIFEYRHGRGGQIIMENGDVIPVSHRKKGKFLSVIKKI